MSRKLTGLVRVARTYRVETWAILSEILLARHHNYLRYALMVASALIVGCSESPPAPQSSSVRTDTAAVPAAARSFAEEELVVRDPIRYENLAIFPVTSRIAKTEDHYITLDEGLKAGTVEIREIAAMYDPAPNSEKGETAPADAAATAENNNEGEVPDEEQLTGFGNQIGSAAAEGNEVNTLIVVNNSDKPLYLMPGEIIIGGSQDRAIANELVVAPRSKPTRIPVYCVESGRWGEKGTEQTLAQFAATNTSPLSEQTISMPLRAIASPGELAREADRGKFVATVGQLSKASRVAIQSERNQSAVWNSVAKTNKQSGVQPDSEAFTANYVDMENVKKLEPYFANLQTSVSELDHVVGVLVAVNGKIETIDVFDSTPLFKKVWPKLLKSYALDAANAAEGTTPGGVEIKRETAEAFLSDALRGNVAASEIGQGVGLTRREGQHVISFSSHVDPGVAPAAMGGMGGAVHFSGYAK